MAKPLPPLPKFNDKKFKCSDGYVSMVTISKLPPDKKQALWAAIKTKQPDLADMLKNERSIQQLKESFGAEIIMDYSEIEALLK